VHDPPIFQVQTHPCIPISIGAVIPLGAISPHHVQFHVQFAGAVTADDGEGAIAAAGSGLRTAVAEVEGVVAVGASGPGAGATGAGAGVGETP
jgi:hypothetical protein